MTVSPRSGDTHIQIGALQNLGCARRAAANKDYKFYSLIKDLSNPKTAAMLACRPTNAPVINDIG
ncbi:MAG: hypothetical protein HZC23_15525 [Rhodocyclales bacterium]|nr:hypothetical protein [Rhodocyclales bacterium]